MGEYEIERVRKILAEKANAIRTMVREGEDEIADMIRDEKERNDAKYKIGIIMHEEHEKRIKDNYGCIIIVAGVLLFFIFSALLNR